MLGEMIECLKGGCGIRVEGYAVFTYQVEIFEGMHTHFVVLVAGRILIGGQEDKAWSNIRACTGGEPIDGADNALVDFGATLEVRVVGGGGEQSR